jgi:hypothetical protein
MAGPGDIRAGRAYVEIGADSKELEDKVKKGQTLLKQLKEGVGSRSQFKDVVEIFKGAGAVAGLALAARTLNDMASAAVKWRDAMAEGGDAAAGATEELIQSLPVLGQIRQAGLAIRELFTGEEAATRAIREEGERINKIMDARLATQKSIVAATKDQAEALKKLMDRMALTGLNPEDRARVESQQKFEAERKDSSETVAKNRADITTKFKTEEAGLEDKIKAMQQQMESLRSNLPSTSRPPLYGPDERYDNLKKFKELEADLQIQHSKLEKAREENAEELKKIDAAARKEAAVAEEAYFREMLDREKKAREQAAAENKKAAAEAAKEQEQQAEQAAERAAEAAKAGMERQVEAIIQSERMKQAGKEIAEILTFGLSGDLTKIQEAVQKAADVFGPSPSSVGTTQFGVAGSLGGGQLQDIAQNTRRSAESLRRMERDKAAGIRIR